MKPGAMAFTVMPYLATSMPSARVNMLRPPFAAQYGSMRRCTHETRLWTEEMLTILPLVFFSTMSAIA